MDSDCFRSDGGDVLVFMGPMGSQGVFVGRLASGRWDYFPAGHITWDAFHQAAYRNHRLDRVGDEALAGLPPLPPLPEVTWQRWEDNFPPPPPRQGRLYQHVAALPEGRTPVYVVLDEDTYETAFGDGEFHYFAGAFLDEQAARRLMAQAGRGRRRHLRRMTLEAGPEGLTMPDFRLEPFDHVSVGQILDSLEEQRP